MSATKPAHPAGLSSRPSGPESSQPSDSEGSQPESSSGAAPTSTGLTYASAGVDIDAGNEAVRRIKAMVAGTRRPEQIGDIGGVAGLIGLPSGVIDPVSPSEAQSFLRITVKDADAAKVGKPFTERVIEATLSSYPGLFPTTPPGPASPYGVYWPTTVARDEVPVEVRVDGVLLDGVGS